MTIEELRSLMIAKGRPLDDVGVKDLAFTRGDAVLLIGTLSEAGIPILGGDVYTSAGERPELTYDNWHCEREPFESDGDFVRRSQDVALRYLELFRNEPEGLYLFTIVTPLHRIGQALGYPSGDAWEKA